MLDQLQKLIRLIESNSPLSRNISVLQVGQVQNKSEKYPIWGFSVGSKHPESPVLFVTGGIHGLERIGVQLAWSLLKTTIDRLIWDRALMDLLEHIRLVVMPLVNPIGFYNFSRSNGNGVDLMRNAPVQSREKIPFLLGGQRYSANLPWFQGDPENMEAENQAIVQLFKQEAFQSRCVISLDFHSGFGVKDRIWFPFSHTSTPFDDLAEMHAITSLFEQTHPYHIYQIEPQSKGYLLNGDIWDYLFLEFQRHNERAAFLPLTLEMGSWNWVKKNPLQIFLKHGAFNPIKEHRIKRTYRRHHLLFDFFLRALRSHDVWSPLEGTLKLKHEQLGIERWYGKE